MSKFFNETLKLRNGALRVEDLLLTPSKEDSKNPVGHEVSSNQAEQMIGFKSDPELQPKLAISERPPDVEVAVAEESKEITVTLSDSPVKTLGESRLAHCRKVDISERCLLRGQFQGSDSLESAEEAYRALRTR